MFHNLNVANILPGEFVCICIRDDQLYMAVCFWYLSNSDWTNNFIRYQKHTAIGRVVYAASSSGIISVDSATFLTRSIRAPKYYYSALKLLGSHHTFRSLNIIIKRKGNGNNHLLSAKRVLNRLP